MIIAICPTCKREFNLYAGPGRARRGYCSVACRARKEWWVSRTTETLLILSPCGCRVKKTKENIRRLIEDGHPCKKR